MGCVTATAKRRRRQAKNKFNHLAKKQRPNYKVRAADVAAAHESNVRAREQARRQRGAK
jgi:hypothetical protein